MRIALVRNLLLNPSVQTTLNSEPKAGSSHATVAGLVVVTAALWLIAWHTVGAVAAVLEPRSKHGEAHSTIVLASSVAGSEQAANGGWPGRWAT